MLWDEIPLARVEKFSQIDEGPLDESKGGRREKEVLNSSHLCSFSSLYDSVVFAGTKLDRDRFPRIDLSNEGKTLRQRTDRKSVV